MTVVGAAALTCPRASEHPSATTTKKVEERNENKKTKQTADWLFARVFSSGAAALM